MADETQQRNRRQAERFTCKGEAEIAVPGRGLRFVGQIANLSLTGCYIECPCRLERGTSVEVWLTTEGLPLRVAANLISHRPNGAAFRFHSLTARRAEQVQHLIAELDRMRAKEPGQGENPEQPPPEEQPEQTASIRPPAPRQRNTPGWWTRRFSGWLRRRAAGSA